MRKINIKLRLILSGYLFVTAVVAVNIHIQMTNFGVRFPTWEPPQWVHLFIYVLQILGAMWLTKRVLNWLNNQSFVKPLLIVSITLAALNQQLIRLPLTAGYVLDQKFLYLWISTYLPNCLVTLTMAAIMVLVARLSILQRRYVDYIIVGGTSCLAFLYLQPAMYSITQPLLAFVSSPDPSGILTSTPYPWQVDAIASVTFIEPVIAAFFVCYLLSNNHRTSFGLLSLKTILVLMILTQDGAKFLFYLYFSTIEDMIERLLSISQFTLEFIVVGLAVSAAMAYLTKNDKPWGANKK